MSNQRSYEAVVLEEYGLPEVLRLRTFTLDAVPDGMAVVNILATSVNNVDTQIRSGKLGHHRPLPHALGPDAVGVVEACPDPSWVGARVVIDPSQGCGICRECVAGRRNRCAKFKILGEDIWGGYSSVVTAPVRNLIRVPDGVETTVAACLPVTFGTAWRLVVSQARIQPSDRVLIVGAGGGVALAARRIARLFGAEVHVLGRPSTKLEQAKAEGYTVWACSEEEVSEVHRRLRSVGGFDIIVDSVGGAWFGAALKSLATGGRLVTCGATVEPKVTIDIRPIFWKHISIMGASGGSAEDLRTILDLARDGRLCPQIDQVLPAAQAADAHQAVERGEVNGKIVLSWET